jgi:tRNA-dihydrouridine synthase 3
MCFVRCAVVCCGVLWYAVLFCCCAGESEKKLNAPRVVRLLHQAGAAAVVVHGRTMEQRYKKAADWSLLSELVQSNPGLPVIGNGDILTHYEAADRCDLHTHALFRLV